MSIVWAPTTAGLRLKRDRLLFRSIWIVWTLILIGAGGYHWVKVQEGRGAFVRWRPQILSFMQGVNIFDKQMFPNPPIFPLAVYPIMVLPASLGAMVWFGLKCVLASFSAILCFRMVRAPSKPMSPWVVGITLLLCLRTIESDLHHANNNIIILTLIVSSLYLWRKGYDAWAGVLLALAISFKVTPALFVPYYMYKRSWKTVAWTFVGMALFLLVVPSLLIGVSFNLECLTSWWKRILSPYLSEGVPSRQEMNQSLVGVMFRLWTESPRGGRYDPVLMVPPIHAFSKRQVELVVKGISVVFVSLLAIFCRTKATRRDDPRLLGEFSLVVLTMLIVSERSWKHHYVTLLLPFTYLTYRCFDPSISRTVRRWLAASLVVSSLFMATTSSELGGLFYGGEGHSVAQWFGMFLWGGVVLYAATAWRVTVERSVDPVEMAAGTLLTHVSPPHLPINSKDLRATSLEPAENTRS